MTFLQCGTIWNLSANYILRCVMARVQQQNRKLWVFGCCGFVWKGITVIFGMWTQLVIVQTMVWYLYKNFSYPVSTHAQIVFLKKLKTAKCSPNPKRPQIRIWTHLNMLYRNPTGSFKFGNFSIFLWTIHCLTIALISMN